MILVLFLWADEEPGPQGPEAEAQGAWTAENIGARPKRMELPLSAKLHQAELNTLGSPRRNNRNISGTIFWSSHLSQILLYTQPLADNLAAGGCRDICKTRTSELQCCATGDYGPRPQNAKESTRLEQTMIIGEHTRLTQTRHYVYGISQSMVLVNICLALVGSDLTSEHFVAISDFISKQTACDDNDNHDDHDDMMMMMIISVLCDLEAPHTKSKLVVLEYGRLTQESHTHTIILHFEC